MLARKGEQEARQAAERQRALEDQVGGAGGRARARWGFWPVWRVSGSGTCPWGVAGGGVAGAVEVARPALAQLSASSWPQAISPWTLSTRAAPRCPHPCCLPPAWSPQVRQEQQATAAARQATDAAATEAAQLRQAVALCEGMAAGLRQAQSQLDALQQQHRRMVAAVPPQAYLPPRAAMGGL